MANRERLSILSEIDPLPSKLDERPRSDRAGLRRIDKRNRMDSIRKVLGIKPALGSINRSDDEDRVLKSAGRF